MQEPIESALAPLRFIPFRRSDVLRMCLAENRLDGEQQQAFQRGIDHISAVYRAEFHQLRQQLKEAYAPLDPDADTRLVAGIDAAESPPPLATTIETVLDRGNYEKISGADLQAAFDAASMFHVRLYVDMEDYDEVLLFCRGVSERREQVKTWFGLAEKTVTFTSFDRVVLYLKFKEQFEEDSALGRCRPGSTMLKLFQNVPAADLEMLFPNTRVGMRFLDKLLIGVPAIISGGIVFTTKLGATLVLLGSLLGFWLGTHSEPVTLDKRAILVLLAGVGAVGGYLWKQYSSFRNRKLKFTQALTENLYFKLLDNNTGVLLRTVDDAEDSECKESMLAYYFLLAAGGSSSAADLDAAIERWFAQRWQCRLDFEIDDALAKLQQLGLAQPVDDRWQLVEPEVAATS
ncbi:MAG: TMEM143 family protein [Halieaceae bacterium]